MIDSALHKHELSQIQRDGNCLGLWHSSQRHRWQFGHVIEYIASPSIREIAGSTWCSESGLPLGASLPKASGCLVMMLAALSGRFDGRTARRKLDDPVESSDDGGDDELVIAGRDVIWLWCCWCWSRSSDAEEVDEGEESCAVVIAPAGTMDLEEADDDDDDAGALDALDAEGGSGGGMWCWWNWFGWRW